MDRPVHAAGQATPAAPSLPRKGRHFLRTAVVAKTALRVGEPVRVRARLRSGAPDDLTTRIAGAIGASRYVSFATPGRHTVPLTVAHADGRQDRVELVFEVRSEETAHPYPVLAVSQQPSNPFLLHVSVKNAHAVHRAGIRYEWEVAGHGAYLLEQPFFVLDCEPLINAKDLLIPFDLLFTAVYPDGVRLTAKESFRVLNDYALLKSRGVLRPRLIYDYRATGAGLYLAAMCLMVNDDDETIVITGRQIDILYADPERPLVPGPLEPLDAVLAPRSRHQFDCSLLRRSLPEATLGYAVHFHGKSRSGFKVEASVYFEHYAYQTRHWADISSLHATDLLNEVKLALAASTACPRESGAGVRRVAPNPTAPPPARSLAPLPLPLSGGLSLTAIQSYLDAMRPLWSTSELDTRLKGLEKIVTSGQLYDQKVGDTGFFLGKQCLPDEMPPTDDLFCKSTGKRGAVFVPARVMNGKKGDVVLLPGGPLGLIGDLLLALNPPQHYSHCGIMTSNYYQLRHATASQEWVMDQLIGTTFLAPDSRGTQGFDPDAIKYIWPGTINQSVDQAFHGSDFLYKTADGKHQKVYRIAAFGADPVYFMDGPRHVHFPLVLKPDPLLEGDPAFAHVRPTLHQVADQAKLIQGHYRFFCYSNGAISLKDDTAHLAPDRGAAWWASGTRPMVCSSLVLAAIDDIANLTIRMEGPGTFTTAADLEKTAPPGPPGAEAPDAHALVDALTRDGMYYYPPEQRLAAADALYRRAYDMALDTAGNIGRALTDAPDDVANQICNTFAYDYSGREFDDEDAKDSEKWRAPGDGHAVGPDDMLNYWDRPTAAQGYVHGLYGTTERIVFRDGLVEERDLGVWAICEKLGKLSVTVSRQGGVVAGCDAKAGGQVQVTNALGVAVLELPEGSYSVEAGVMLNGLFYEGRGTAKVTDRGNAAVTVELNDPPEFNRLVVIGGNISIKDLETFGSDEILHEGFSLPLIRLGALNRRASVPYVRKWGGEIRVEVTLDLTWNADLSVSVAAAIKLYEGTSEDTDDLDGEGGNLVEVAKDAVDVPLHGYARNDAEDDDDHVILDLLIANYADL